MFKLHSEYKPTGDQPQAIEYLSNGIKQGKKFQTLLSNFHKQSIHFIQFYPLFLNKFWHIMFLVPKDLMLISLEI